jgi:hypothetical protein
MNAEEKVSRARHDLGLSGVSSSDGVKVVDPTFLLTYLVLCVCVLFDREVSVWDNVDLKNCGISVKEHIED